MKLQSHLARTLLLEPNHRVVWKVYPDEESTEPGLFGAVDFMGIVDFRVDQTDSGCHFSANTYYELLMPFTDEAELAAYRTKTLADTEVTLAAMWPRLKALVEQGGADGGQ